MDDDLKFVINSLSVKKTLCLQSHHVITELYRFHKNKVTKIKKNTTILNKCHVRCYKKRKVKKQSNQSMTIQWTNCLHLILS